MTKQTPENFAKAAEGLARQEYKRGWNEAVAEMNAHMAKVFVAAGLVKPQETAAAAVAHKATLKKARKKKYSARRGNSRKIVADAIKNNPGKTGTEIAFMVTDKVNKHTVRTQLRKLKMADEIEQHELRWYAKGAHRQAA